MAKSIMNKMVKNKKESEKNCLKWIAVSGFVFAGLVLVFNLSVYFSLFVEAVKSLDWLFFVQFIFSNNILFALLFVLASFYLMKANSFARVLWIVLSLYFFIPSLPSLIGYFSDINVFSSIALISNLFLVVSSLFLLFNKKIKEEFR